MTKQSTDKKQLHWLSRCRIDTCHEIRVKCPECKKMGHVSPHIMTNTENQVLISIQHSHFVEEQDGGRNIYCETGKPIDIHSSNIKRSWRLTKVGRRRLIDVYSEKWEK
ncbi:MAG TPA: hypothetical protein VL854_06850 [Nitrososphaeraceae archaeon]|nr:hypothetical protein [Nitrososphaeraceae archaeon]